jgi:hypothetical protein
MLLWSRGSVKLLYPRPLWGYAPCRKEQPAQRGCAVSEDDARSVRGFKYMGALLFALEPLVAVRWKGPNWSMLKIWKCLKIERAMPGPVDRKSGERNKLGPRNYDVAEEYV